MDSRWITTFCAVVRIMQWCEMGEAINLAAILIAMLIVGLSVVFAVYAVKTAALFNRERRRLDAEIAELKRRLGR